MMLSPWKAGGPHHPARLEHFMYFVEKSGGNLDWVMHGDIAPLIWQYAQARAARARPLRGLVYPVEPEECKDAV
jgi:hypothetical protein